MLSVSSGEQAVISYQDHTCYCPIVQSRRYVKERKDRMKRLESAQAPLEMEEHTKEGPGGGSDAAPARAHSHTSSARAAGMTTWFASS